MTYQEYFRKAEFEDIWTILSGFYGENEALKPEYEALVAEITELPILPEHSSSPIKMQLALNNEVMVVGAPDPQEWLLGREVEIDFSYWPDDNESEKCDVPNLPFDMLTSKQKRQLARQSDTAALAAHLLYWSTLYDIKTSRQHKDEFVKWLQDRRDGVIPKFSIEPEWKAESRHKKQLKYWRSGVCGDSAIFWSYNLHILRHKLEYNIGYWRYVQRHIGWEEDVRRMQLACSLMDIASNNDIEIEGIYVNASNVKRFYRDYFNLDNPESRDFFLSEIRKAKAYDILWKFLSHNMKDWWD